MTVKDIEISHAIWVKKIVALKGNATRKKPIHVAGDIVKIAMEIIKLHKEVFMTEDILFVDGILFLFC